MRCLQCQADNRGRAQFCRACGGRLERVCPSCGARAEPDSKFCDACGAELVCPAAPSRFAKGLEVCTGTNFAFGIGEGQRVLGLIARAGGAFDEAATWLTQALETFGGMQARFYAGRAHLDLASLAGARGEREAAATHLRVAHSLFVALRVPKYVDRAEQLAREFDVALSSEDYDAH